jgi:LytS/YehU family sensor histidine kinase
MEIIKNHFHPHFLSESLRNISHLIRNRSEQSAQSIIKLADLLSYFLYENEAEHVTLDQELQMVRTYLELEKLFYGERINVSLKEEGISSGPFVAPLIIVSIVQYCCEQSLLSIQQNLSVDIQVQSAADRVKFYLNCNGYYENINGVARDHTTLDQVIKRVQALYPGKHNLTTHSENGIFSLMLALNHEDEELDLRPEIKPAYELA